MQGDRPKAYRPIPPELRQAAFEDGLAAYSQGNFFEAHELLEPAWMGTSDLAERALYQARRLHQFALGSRGGFVGTR